MKVLLLKADPYFFYFYSATGHYYLADRYPAPGTGEMAMLFFHL
jgi:hypothetical protein